MEYPYGITKERQEEKEQYFQLILNNRITSASSYVKRYKEDKIDFSDCKINTIQNPFTRFKQSRCDFTVEFHSWCQKKLQDYIDSTQI